MLYLTVFKAVIAELILLVTVCKLLIMSSNLPGLNLFIVSRILINEFALVFMLFNLSSKLSIIAGAFSEPAFIASITALVYLDISLDISFNILISFLIIGAILFKLVFEVLKKSFTSLLNVCAFLIVCSIIGISS